MGALVLMTGPDALPPLNHECRAAGLPIRLLAASLERAYDAARARIAASEPAPAPAPEPETPAVPPPEPTAVTTLLAPADAPALTAADPAVLPRTLRGFTLTDLYLEACRAAAAAAAEFEHLEGLACGRTYGDRSIAAVDLWIPDSYRHAAVEAKRRAEAAGATADFLRGLLGREAAVAALLPERNP